MYNIRPIDVFRTMVIAIAAVACCSVYAANGIPQNAGDHCTFEEGLRYSELVINSRINDFKANTTASGFGVFDHNGQMVETPQNSTSVLDYVPGLVAKAILEAADYYKDSHDVDVAPWYYAVHRYATTCDIASNGKQGQSFDDLNAVKLYFKLAEMASSQHFESTDATVTTALANQRFASALAGIAKANNNYVITEQTLAGAAGGWWHKSSYTNQMWCDGQYMGPALLAQIINEYDGYEPITDDDWGLIAKQFTISWQYLWNDEVKLLYHAFTADPAGSAASSWAGISAEKGHEVYHSAEYWGRAEAWYFLALVDVLEQMDKAGRAETQDYQTLRGYLQQLANQRILTLLAIGFIIMLLLLLTGYYMYQRQKARLNAEREQMSRDQLDFYTQVSHELRTPLTLIEGPLAQLAKTDDMHAASPEAADLFAIVRRNTRQLTILVNKMLDMQVGGKVGDMPVEQFDEITVSHPIAEPAAHDVTEEAPTVLIIDDNADIRAYLRMVLKGKYRLFEAEDGQKGLEVARAEVPDIIISDVMMPVMNGLQLCQQVKDDDITSHIPVILLTARALSKHQIEGYDSGADAYITKPFAPDLLIARIDNLLRNRHLLKDIWQEKTTNSSTPNTTAAPSVTADTKEDVFITRFKKVVEEQLDNSDIGVEDLGSALGLSRVQLYRKIKALTGYSPVDLLRKARLAKAQQLLLSTDYAVSEIAYKVGFTSPSYFTKCFKDEYGKVPGEARN